MFPLVLPQQQSCCVPSSSGPQTGNWDTRGPGAWDPFPSSRLLGLTLRKSLVIKHTCPPQFLSCSLCPLSLIPTHPPWVLSCNPFPLVPKCPPDWDQGIPSSCGPGMSAQGPGPSLRLLLDTSSRTWSLPPQRGPHCWENEEDPALPSLWLCSQGGKADISDSHMTPSAPMPAPSPASSHSWGPGL